MPTKHERRIGYRAKRKIIPIRRQEFDAADHIREDWNYALVAEFLEARARGYNGLLRQILCTAAHMLKEAAPVMREHEAAKEPATNAFDQLTMTPPVVTKRNQQPGRLSGGEREALRKFAASVFAAGRSKHLLEEAMGEGRVMLANVRKRALGVTAEEDKS